MKLHLVEFESPYPGLRQLKSDLLGVFKFEISVHEKILKAPNEYFNQRKAKWNAQALLFQLREEFLKRREGKFMVLGIFPNDMYADGLNFVYGLSERNGTFSVISHFRLDEKFYGRHFDQKILSERVTKEAIHEIGHMLNLPHCTNKKCVMSFSPNIFFVDRKTANFCDKCKKFI